MLFIPPPPYDHPPAGTWQSLGLAFVVVILVLVMVVFA